MKGALSIVVVVCSLGVSATAEIPLYDAPVATDRWTGPARSYYSDIFRTNVVTNVSEPTLTAFLPAKDQANGVAVVIAPGGGFHALSIDSEGNDVARWLNERGVAAFVLRYRLVPTGEDGVKEMVAKSQEASSQDMASIVPLAGADGLAAMALVRARADEFNVNPMQVGFMGFSAGGTVTMHVAYHHDTQSKPAFIAPIYAARRLVGEVEMPEYAPPAFIVAATDDQLNLAPDSITIYNQWLGANASAELHMYARGGHGFGMRTQGLPSDRWIERFGDWLDDWRSLGEVPEKRDANE